MHDYYAAAAQVIPILLLALLLDQRLNSRKGPHPGARALAIIVIALAAIVGEGICLEVLFGNTTGTHAQAGLVAASIAAIASGLFLITIADPFGVWWRKKTGAPRPSLTRRWVILIGFVTAALLLAAFCWASNLPLSSHGH